MTITGDGECRVEHMWFQSIFDLLEHFRTYSIPLESGNQNHADVLLSEYVIYSEKASDSTEASKPAEEDILEGAVEEQLRTSTFGGSVRLTSIQLDQVLPPEQLKHSEEEDPDYQLL